VTLVTPGTSAARFSSCSASLPSQRFPFDTLRFEPFRFATGRTFISHACIEPSSASHPHRTYRCDSIDISDLLIICCTACGLNHLGTFVALRCFSLRSCMYDLQTRAFWCLFRTDVFRNAFDAAGFCVFSFDPPSLESLLPTLAALFRICAHRRGWISSAIYAVFSALVALRSRRLRALAYDIYRCFRLVAFGFAFDISSCVHSLSMPSACCGSA
jgi:hypothetical protein